MPKGLFSVKSNIDGHWIRTAGVGEARTWECHGAVTHLQYVHKVRGDEKTPWPTDHSQIEALSVPECDLEVGENVEARLQDGRWIPGVVGKKGRIMTEAVEGQKQKPLHVFAVRRPGGEDLFRVRESSRLPCDSEGRALRPNVLMFDDGKVDRTRIDNQE